jgi:NADH dehydrogenase [ubiquinone] 1 alpha subcomplex assembly factor 1
MHDPCPSLRPILARVPALALTLTLALASMMTRYGLPDARAADAGGPARIAVLDFGEAAASAGFRSIDDVVMGGMSASRVSVRGGALRFEGTVSLERGGGFASMRGPLVLPTDARALLIEVRGDGQRYRLTLKTSDDNAGHQHQAGFIAPADWTTLRFEPQDFQASFRGRPLDLPPPRLDAQRALGVLIADRQAGRFELEIRRVWALP